MRGHACVQEKRKRGDKERARKILLSSLPDARSLDMRERRRVEERKCKLDAIEAREERLASPCDGNFSS